MNISFDNGLSMLCYPMYNTHSITIGLYMRYDSLTDEEMCSGAVHFLEHLKFRSCGRYPQEELYYRMERIGSSLRGITYRDFLYFSLKINPVMLDSGIEIVENLLQNSNWAEREFEKERQVVINQILSEGNYVSLEKEMRKLVFKNHPYQFEIMGDPDVIADLKVSDMQKMEQKLFSKGNILCCVTGNIKQAEIDRLFIRLNTVRLSSAEKRVSVIPPSSFGKREPDMALIHVEDDNPLEVRLSFDIINHSEFKDYITVLNGILGEGVGSRLQMRIREEKCYATDISSYIEWYTACAVMHINLIVDQAKLYDSLNEVISILNDLKSGIQYRDLETTLPFYRNNDDFLEDDTEEMNFQLGYNYFVLGSHSIKNEIAFTQQSICCLQNLAVEIFQRKNLSLTIVGSMDTVTRNGILSILEKLG